MDRNTLALDRPQTEVLTMQTTRTTAYHAAAAAQVDLVRVLHVVPMLTLQSTLHHLLELLLNSTHLWMVVFYQQHSLSDST